MAKTANSRRTTRKPRGLVAPVEKLPPSHLRALQEAGFTTVAYLNVAIRVQAEDEGEISSEWLPRLCIAPGNTPNSYRVIEWLPKGHPSNAYSFDGWSARSGHTFGGMNKTIHQALAWFTWLADQLNPTQPIRH